MLVILCGSVGTTLALASPSYAQWKAVADFSQCPRQYISETHGEEHGFSTQQQCQARIGQAQSQLACARYTCQSEGTGQTGDAGAGGDLLTQSTNALAKGFVSGNSQEVGLGLLGLGMNSLLQGMQGDPNGEARRAQEAAAQQRQAAAEQQRRAAEAARHAAAIKSQLLDDGIGGTDSSPSPPLVGANDDIKLLTSDQLLGGTGTKFFGSGGNGCAPSQDASVVDLCGLGDRPAVVDPSTIKIDPSAVNVGGAGLTTGKPDAVIRVPNKQTANADVAPRAVVAAKQKGAQPAPNDLQLSPAALAKVVPLLRQPDLSRPIGTTNRPAICESLSTQLDETYQLARRAVLASDVYDRYKPGKAPLPVAAAFDRISDNVDGKEMKALFPGMDGKAIKSLIEPNDSDYRAAIYKDRTTNKVFAVFRGTEPLSSDDWKNGNADQAFGLSSTYYKRAMELTSKLKRSTAAQKPPLDLELVGHSMGGGMADAAGAASQIKATSFNPSGVNANSLPAGTDMSTAAQYDTDIVVNGEILNAHQDHPSATRATLATDLALGGPLTAMAAVSNVAAGATTGLVGGGNGDAKKSVQETSAAFSAALPPAIGRRVTLAPDSGDAGSVDPFRLHYIDSVVDAIVKRSQELYGQYTFNECGS